MIKTKKQKALFKATKIVPKPTGVVFRTKDGKEVNFKAKRDIPISVRVEFFARKK